MCCATYPPRGEGDGEPRQIQILRSRLTAVSTSDWLNHNHEVALSLLWEYVERILVKNM